MKEQQQKFYLTAEAIYRYLIGADEALDTQVTCNPDKVYLLTSDQSLYEALGAFEDKTLINYFKLVKLLEVAEINSFSKLMKSPRKILTETRADEIRRNKND